MTNLLRAISATLSGPAVQLILTSATLLFVELFLIRWIPANVVYVGYFSNFLLMASFLGIGTGILLGRSGRRLPTAAFPLLFLVVVALVSGAQLNLQLDSPDEVYFGLADLASSADVNFLVLPLVMVLTVVVMAGLAMPLAPLLRAMPPLRAYALDIGGSMAGIALFTALAAAGTGPPLWVVVVGVLSGLVAIARPITRWTPLAAAAMASAFLVTISFPDTWSPYQRLSVFEAADAVHLNANGVPHQGFYRDPDHPLDLFYSQVDRWFPGRTYDRVLVIGAGTGNDVTAALRRGAVRVDAVEIDPAIQRVGIERHPHRPYQDPRVRRHVDDGRAFLRNSKDEYDLIVFALPDSLTLVTGTAAIRLESFLFTQQAFESARDHLAPGGTFVMYNFYRQPWLLQKLAAMLTDAFGYEPIATVYGGYSGTAAVLATGPAVEALHGGPPPGDTVTAIDVSGAPRPSTDDWPFLYLREPGISPHYVAALGFLLLFALLVVLGAARSAGTGIRRFSPHFFVLGVAFLLLETRSIVTFSLLFGNTWIVNAFVFFAILASVLAAIAVNARFRIRDHRPLYAALFAAIAIAWLVPPASLLFDPPWLRYAVAAVLGFAPVFFANLVFTHSFRDTRTADMAFASNILGATLGGAVEYVALVTGYQALLLIVAALYGAAYLLATRIRVLADRELNPSARPDVEARELAGA